MYIFREYLAKNGKDSASQIVESIWPLSAVALRSNSPVGCKGVLPLRTFIQETLRRSRTSYSTLQVALYYLIKVKPHLPKRDFTMEQSPDKPISRAMQCGRRMFLAALILASKYLQDRNYSARAWSKISGLTTLEINQIELLFLDAVGWRLHISQAIFHRWTDIVLRYTPSPSCQSSTGDGHCWSSIVPKLTARLDTIDLEPATSWGYAGFESVPGADSSPPLSPKISDSNSASSSLSFPPSLPSKTEQTSTCQRGLPPTLEPTRIAEYSNPPFPALPKLSLLPTPQMTPESSAASTPAVGAGSIYSIRPSICTALSQAQGLCLARSTLDQRPRTFACHKPTALDAMVCRSSLARSASSTSSTSLASSPESMVSDVSSMSFRSSRSSSISSSSSTSCTSIGSSGAPATCAPFQPSRAAKATRRGATNSLKECRKNLVIASPIDEVSFFEVCNSPESYTGPVGSTADLTNYSVNVAIDLATSTREAAQGLCELAGAVPRSKPFSEPNPEPRRCRKRGRTTSEDSLLQSNVRHLMALGMMKNSEVVLPDQNISASFLVPESQSGLSSSGNRVGSIKLPVLPSGSTGISSIKRACCESEPYVSRRRP